MLQIRYTNIILYRIIYCNLFFIKIRGILRRQGLNARTFLVVKWKTCNGEFTLRAMADV